MLFISFTKEKISCTKKRRSSQIIEASRYSNCEITAIDLSKSSITYAKRKVDEYGLKNVPNLIMPHYDVFDLWFCSFLASS